MPKATTASACRPGIDLEEFKVLRALSERIEPLMAVHSAKVRLNFGEHLHAGLMQSLSATVSSDRP